MEEPWNMISKRSQSWNNTLWFYSYEIYRIGKIIKTPPKKDIRSCQWLRGVGIGDCCLTNIGFLPGWWILEMGDDGSCMTLWIYLMPVNCTLKMVNFIKLWLFYYNKKQFKRKWKKARESEGRSQSTTMWEGLQQPLEAEKAMGWSPS